VKTDKVAIIGGGLAGLTVARLLQAADVDFVLLEAQDRLGGRILSAGADGLPSEDGFDLGPSWYWPHMQPAIDELVEELGLAAFCQNSDGDVIFERMSREAAQRYRASCRISRACGWSGERHPLSARWPAICRPSGSGSKPA
jgi:monoamine oxidase